MKVKGYDALDRQCPKRPCWSPGKYQHRGATQSGSRNTGHDTKCCLRRAYHGCPPSVGVAEKMSVHPNTLLMAVITPQDPSIKLELIRDLKSQIDDVGNVIKIDGDKYFVHLMLDDYDTDLQIRANAGDFIVFDHVTYGYGEKIKWEAIEKRKRALEEWTKWTCERNKCTYEIFVSANYW